MRNVGIMMNELRNIRSDYFQDNISTFISRNGVKPWNTAIGISNNLAKI
jgi:hypothetical protein